MEAPGKTLILEDLQGGSRASWALGDVVAAADSRSLVG